LPNVGPYIYDVSISGFTRSSIYIYEISSLRVNGQTDTLSLSQAVASVEDLLKTGTTDQESIRFCSLSARV